MHINKLVPVLETFPPRDRLEVFEKISEVGPTGRLSGHEGAVIFLVVVVATRADNHGLMVQNLRGKYEHNLRS